LAADAVAPSPKLHDRDAMVPSVSVLVSANEHASAVHDDVNAAVGAALPLPPPPVMKDV
jgi:hypothetical protein